MTNSRNSYSVPFEMREKVRRVGGWPTARLARQNFTGSCWACTRHGGVLVVKERRETGGRSYGWYHTGCLPTGRVA